MDSSMHGTAGASSDLSSWIDAVPMMAEGYHLDMLSKVEKLRRTRTIYPPRGLEFYALAAIPFSAVKVVIVGQDPYHGAGQAHGLAFSVPEGVTPPPSLRNIFKEIAEDVYDDQPPVSSMSTDLTRWARQGVLLLNASLTVEAGLAGSHRDLGWTALTDALIKELSRQRDHLVLMLWGDYAQSKRALIDGARHLVLEAPHPSPLSAYRGFFGCRHFSSANEYLEQHGREPINW
ncbi:MAG: uracil-DNA glycosylase [Anaerolineae bacterium]